MNILYDLITPQAFVGGAGEYVRKVFYTLHDTIKELGKDVKIFGLYNSSKKIFSYSDLDPKSISQLGVIPVDIADTTLKDVIANYKINKVFIGCAQYWNGLDLESIQCPVVCVTHDLDVEEYDRNKIDDYVRLGSFKKYLKYRFHVYRHGKKDLVNNLKIKEMLLTNPQAQLITVSEYSKRSIMYNFGLSADRIKVLYSPERVTKSDFKIDNSELKMIIDGGKKYFLMIGANRLYKNPFKAINAFKKYVEQVDKDAFLVTLGCKKKFFENQIVLPYLSESDLINAYANSYAFLFPSYFEGFGYPPIEAMKFGKPVFASNVTSIPEILGDAAIFFNPFYETEIFNALLKLTDDNYFEYSRKAFDRYAKVHLRQEKDLKQLVNIILQE